METLRNINNSPRSTRVRILSMVGALGLGAAALLGRSSYGADNNCQPFDQLAVGKPYPAPSVGLETIVDARARTVEERISGTSEITGRFPASRFELSCDIQAADLIPTVYRNETPTERVNMAVSYVQRLHNFLEKNPGFDSPTLASLRMNTPENYPINFGPSATVSSVLSSFLEDMKNGDFVIDPVAVDTKDFYFGTINTPVIEQGIWKIKSKVNVAALTANESVNKENGDLVYYQDTDLQMALKLIHEFGHRKQDEAILKQILSDSGLTATVATGKESMPDLIFKMVKFHLKRIHEKSFPGMTGFIYSNEASATNLSMLTYDSLLKINVVKHLPGANHDDPFPISPGSLYRTFDLDVLKSPDGAMAADWIMTQNKGYFWINYFEK